MFVSLTSSSRAVKGTAVQRESVGHNGYDSLGFQKNIGAREQETFAEIEGKFLRQKDRLFLTLVCDLYKNILVKLSVTRRHM